MFFSYWKGKAREWSFKIRFKISFSYLISILWVVYLWIIWLSSINLVKLAMTWRSPLNFEYKTRCPNFKFIFPSRTSHTWEIISSMTRSNPIQKAPMPHSTKTAKIAILCEFIYYIPVQPHVPDKYTFTRTLTIDTPSEFTYKNLVELAKQKFEKTTNSTRDGSMFRCLRVVWDNSSGQLTSCLNHFDAEEWEEVFIQLKTRVWRDRLVAVFDASGTRNSGVCTCFG